jgi:hypothetical protein
MRIQGRSIRQPRCGYDEVSITRKADVIISRDVEEVCRISGGSEMLVRCRDSELRVVVLGSRNPGWIKATVGLQGKLRLSCERAWF